MNDLHKFWDEIETLLLEAMAAMHSALNSDDAEAVTECLGHNELELALREVQSAAQTQGILLSIEAVQSHTRAAFVMGVDL